MVGPPLDVLHTLQHRRTEVYISTTITVHCIISTKFTFASDPCSAGNHPAPPSSHCHTQPPLLPSLLFLSFRMLPLAEMGEKDTPQQFADRVQEQLATSLGAECSTASRVEFKKWLTGKLLLHCVQAHSECHCFIHHLRSSSSPQAQTPHHCHCSTSTWPHYSRVRVPTDPS